jgi:hypothetical protein
MIITLEPVTQIDTSDVLYDTKMKHLCVYPQSATTFDEEYIKTNCLKLVIDDTETLHN